MKTRHGTLCNTTTNPNTPRISLGHHDQTNPNKPQVYFFATLRLDQSKHVADIPETPRPDQSETRRASTPCDNTTRQHTPPTRLRYRDLTNQNTPWISLRQHGPTNQSHAANISIRNTTTRPIKSRRGSVCLRHHDTTSNRKHDAHLTLCDTTIRPIRFTPRTSPKHHGQTNQIHATDLSATPRPDQSNHDTNSSLCHTSTRPIRFTRRISL